MRICSPDCSKMLSKATFMEVFICPRVIGASFIFSDILPMAFSASSICLAMPIFCICDATDFALPWSMCVEAIIPTIGFFARITPIWIASKAPESSVIPPAVARPA